MAVRRWGPWLVVLGAAAAACSLTVGKADLDSVACTEDNAMGPPACDYGQMCLGGRCTACADLDLCGDGIDNDCNNGPDDGCAGSAGNGGGSQGGTGNGGKGGQAGRDASDDHNAAGSSGEGGSAGGGQGGTSQGGAAGNGGEAGIGGASTGGSSQGGTGGQPPLRVIGETCGGDGECASGRCVADVGPNAGSACTTLCCSSDDCPTNFGCAPSGVGNLCKAANRLGAPAAGPGKLGEPCTKNDQCVSLRCDTNAQKCTDACCTDTQCGGGTCGYGASWQCSTAGPSKGDMADCSSGGCDSRICSSSKKCMGSCCGDADCEFPHICEYTLLDGEAIRVCVTTLGSSDTPCCTDAQCGGGQRCTYVEEDLYNPLPVSMWVLRCK